MFIQSEISRLKDQLASASRLAQGSCNAQQTTIQNQAESSLSSDAAYCPTSTTRKKLQEVIPLHKFCFDDKVIVE